MRWLAGLPERDQLPPNLAMGPDLHFWRLAARFQLSLLARQRFVPTLLVSQSAEGNKGQDGYLAVWHLYLRLFVFLGQHSA